MVPISSSVKPPKVQAAEPEFKVLEIVATGSTSQLSSSSFKKYNLQIDTIPMKKFVSQRDELDGKYDMVAIMNGNYTSSGVSGKNHNTLSRMNDITNLRAGQIITGYIEKGLPVILHGDSVDTGDKLEANFQKYVNNPRLKPNVLSYSSTSDITTFLNKYVLNNRVPRPSMQITEKPSNSKQFKPEELMTFKFTTSVGTRDLKAVLYIDTDFNDRYNPEEVVVEQAITSNTTTLSYKLPKGYSGIRNWKLELVDNFTGLKDYESGRIKFKHETVQIKVLQVTPPSDSSSLKRENNMKQSFLKREGEYNIAIDVINMNTFKSSYHNNLNGKYDMVIFGFGDSYNVNAQLNESSVTSLKEYIASQQSIMFTHDTVFKANSNDNNLWVRNFMGATGQKNPQTDLGFGAPNQSTRTVKVNDGLITNYPYELADSIKIANTHNQYFTLDLEDEEVTPWFNIEGSSRDVNDSYNHYYMYTKGNITYSGTGHTSTGFPEAEQQLFVNTMYRAFLGANHAPIITVLSPEANSIIPSNQNIELSYKLEDYDLIDKKLDTKVYLNGKEVYSQNDVTKDSTVIASIDHKITEDKEVTVRIEATDERGAVGRTEFKLNIAKVQASLEVNRTTNAANPTKVDEPVIINYRITPKEITGKAAESIKENQVTVDNIMFKETFPAGLGVSESVKKGTLESGYVVDKKLNNIVYNRVGNKFIADPVHFSISVTPTDKKEYILSSSGITYNDLTDINEKANFNNVTLVAEYGLKELIFPDSYVLNKDSSKNFRLDLDFNPKKAGIKDIRWSEGSGGKILRIDPVSGTAVALNKGTTTVQVVVTDVFGTQKTKTALVTVRVPINDFSIEDIELKVGEEISLPIVVDPSEERDSLELKLGDDSLVSINKTKFTLTGLKVGETFLTVSAVNDQGEKIEKVAKVTVKEVPIVEIIVSPRVVNIKKNETFDKFTVLIQPSNATNKNLIWESENTNLVSIVGNGVIQGVGTGSTIVNVYSEDRKVHASITVHVGQPLTGISVPETLNVQKGSSKNLGLVYLPTDATDVSTVTYSSDNPYFVTINQDGVITGKRYGNATITTTVTTEDGKSFTKETLVTVVEDEDDGRGGDLY